MARENRSAESRSTNQLIENVYDLTVAPERLEHLVDEWMNRLNGAVDFSALQLLEDPEVIGHVERAERLIREMIVHNTDDAYSAIHWADTARSAAFVINRDTQEVVAANTAARNAFALESVAGRYALPFEPESLNQLFHELSKPTAPPREHLMRLKRVGSNTTVLSRVVVNVAGKLNMVGILTSELHWPVRLDGVLQQAFRLTDAETAVLKSLVLGQSVKDISGQTGRAEGTVRSQIHALFSKTGVRSQVELVRVTLGLMESQTANSAIVPLAGPLGINPVPNSYHTLQLPDGRKLDYLRIGAKGGRPFVFLPTDAGFTRLTPDAEQWLEDNDIEMIVPIRAGYGHSSPIPQGRDAYENAIADTLQLCDDLAMTRFPILAMCDDFHLAICISHVAPSRVTAIIGLGAVMPATKPIHFSRMPKWTRFIIAAAKHAPRTLPYVAMGFFRFARRLGPKASMKLFLADSPADAALLDDNVTLTALLQGSEISIGPKFTAHVAWAAGCKSNFGVDWTQKLLSCKIPMILFAGQQDPFAPFETTKEFAALSPFITLHAYPERGQLLYPEWPKFLAEIEKYLPPG